MTTMTHEQQELIKKIWWHPIFGPGDRSILTATEDELENFESTYYSIPKEYRWFLKHLGGGGVEPLDTIAKLPESHRKFHSEGWHLPNTFVIGWDNGNPFGIEQSTREILIEDHDYGGAYLIAPSLAAFLREQIFGDPFDESFQDWDKERIERFKRTGDPAPKTGWPGKLRRLKHWAISQLTAGMLKDDQQQQK